MGEGRGEGEPSSPSTGEGRPVRRSLGEGGGEGEKGLGRLGAVGSLFAVGPLWGGTSIAASAGHAESGRSQGDRISAGAVQRPAFASPCTDSEEGQLGLMLNSIGPDPSAARTPKALEGD